MGNERIEKRKEIVEIVYFSHAAKDRAPKFLVQLEDVQNNMIEKGKEYNEK